MVLLLTSPAVAERSTPRLMFIHCIK